MEQRQAFDTAVDAVLKGKFSLKMEQRTALESFLERKDVFALLPTGFGKSLIYQRKEWCDWFKLRHSLFWPQPVATRGRRVNQAISNPIRYGLGQTRISVRVLKVYDNQATN